MSVTSRSSRISQNSKHETRSSDKKVDRLSLFLERIAALKCEDEDLKRDRTRKLAFNLTKTLVNDLFFRDFRILQYFDFPEIEENYDNMNFHQVDDNTFSCRIFLKRFTHHGSCKLYTGLQEDLPPGLALYKMNEGMTTEEKMVIKSRWSPCLDDKGHITPAAIYPWFTEAILASLKSILAKDDKSDDQSDDQSDERKEFNDDNSTIVDEESNKSEISDEKSDKPNEHEDNSDEKLVFHVSLQYPVVSLIAEMGEQKAVVNIFPSIRGDGWPPGARLHHALPKQRPFCYKGQETLQEVEDKMADGQPVWFMDAKPPKLAKCATKSPKFRNTLRHIGTPAHFWTLSFIPVEEIIYNSLEKTCAEHNIDLQEVVKILANISRHHGWSFVNANIIKTIVLWTFKKHMCNMKNLGACIMKCLDMLKTSMTSQSLQSFFLANSNLLQGIKGMELTLAGNEIKELLENIKKDEAHVLMYLGYYNEEI